MIDAPGLVIVTVASLTGASALFIRLFLEKKQGELLTTDKYKLFLLLSAGVGLALANGLFYSALQLTTIASASLTRYLGPLLVVMIFAPLLLKEKISRALSVATLVGFVGLILILLPELVKSRIDVGILFALGAAVFAALYLVFMKKLSMNFKIDSKVVSFYLLFPSAIIFLPFVLFHIQSSGMLPLEEWLKMSFVGVGLLAPSLLLLFRGLELIPAARASIITYLEPVGAILLAFVFLHENLTLLIILGGILILSSGLFVTLQGAKQKP